jgi:hypothetical protein
MSKEPNIPKTFFYESDGKILCFRAEKLEKTLPAGVYDLKQGKMGFFLEKRETLKTFDMYGDTSFYDRIISEFEHCKANLGAYFQGIAGAGKTVACNYICSNMDLPIICIDDAFDGDFVQYLSELNTKAIIYIDEADKVFEKFDDDAKNPTNALLTLLDGKHKTNFLFLLTSNDFIKNKHLYNRLGRLRYLKIFNGVSQTDALEIVDKYLNRLDHREELVKLLKNIKPLTYDTIESLIADVNFHNDTPFDAVRHMCLVRTFDINSHEKYNLHMDDKMFEIKGYYDTVNKGEMFISDHKFPDELKDHLAEGSLKIAKSVIRITNIKQLEGHDTYHYEGEIVSLGKTVYLSIRSDKTFNGKLFRHPSESF